ncbi:hypothetical protein Acr_28g0012870 [Actinidia rufa]|uniref:Uncharacterized protein n=1 Tax=Actinidia rufa TaxID=165716 RepID=A0A7J0HBW5_9ERIC|nr:hypothetical protein Acr_28g0012870 [Actinidia rufa]
MLQRLLDLLSMTKLLSSSSAVPPRLHCHHPHPSLSFFLYTQDSVCRIPARWSCVHQKVADPGYYGKFPVSDVNDEADPPLIYARPMEMSRRVTCVVSVDWRRLWG